MIQKITGTGRKIFDYELSKNTGTVFPDQEIITTPILPQIFLL